VDQLTITQQELGLLHRLPYFYAEDLALDEVFAATSEQDRAANILEKQGMFRPLKRIMKSRRSGDYIQFWFTSDQVSQPCVLMVKSDNVLLSMIEDLFNRPALALKANLHGTHFKSYHKNRTVYFMANVQLA